MSIVTMIVDRMHVSASDAAVKGNITRRLRKDISAEDKALVHTEALERHHANQAFFKSMRF